MHALRVSITVAVCVRRRSLMTQLRNRRPMVHNGHPLRIRHDATVAILKAPALEKPRRAVQDLIAQSRRNDSEFQRASKH